MCLIVTEVVYKGTDQHGTSLQKIWLGLAILSETKRWNGTIQKFKLFSSLPIPMLDHIQGHILPPPPKHTACHNRSHIHWIQSGHKLQNGSINVWCW